ncbi:MAG: hypothetical protein IPG06_20920 [Haliea sp.]|nr:hypothetical protein [Haliea sp.]
MAAGEDASSELKRSGISAKAFSANRSLRLMASSASIDGEIPAEWTPRHPAHGDSRRHARDAQWRSTFYDLGLDVATAGRFEFIVVSGRWIRIRASMSDLSHRAVRSILIAPRTQTESLRAGTVIHRRIIRHRRTRRDRHLAARAGRGGS